MKFLCFRPYHFAVILLLIFHLSACVKGDDESLSQTCELMFFNAYSGSSDGVDFLINNSKLRTGTVGFDSVSRYNQVFSGHWTISATSPGGKAAFTSVDADLAAGKYYSCFFAGSSSSPQLLVVPDDVSAPDSSNRAKVRFINLSSSAGSVDLHVKDSVTLFANCQYMKAGNYGLIDTSARKLEVRQAGTSGSVIATADFHAGSRRIYTLYLRDSIQNRPVLSWKVYQR